jgi:integrase
LEASNWLAEIKTEMLKDTYEPQSNISVGEWVLEYIAMYCKDLRPNTIKRYLQSARHLSPIAGIELQKLTAHAVQKLYNKLDMSASSKVKVHRLLSSAFKKAHQLDMISKNIMIAVSSPKADHYEVEVFTELEIKKLLSSVQESKYYSKYYPFLCTAISTGARLGELLGLKVLSIKNERIVINNNLQYIKNVPTDFPPKTKAGIRTITISKRLEVMLKRLSLDGTIGFDGYVFHTKLGTPYRATNIAKVWKSILMEANIPYKNFHVLRHTHATQLLANGVPLLEVSKRLGHSKPSTTLNLYGHAIKGYDAQIPDKVASIFGV